MTLSTRRSGIVILTLSLSRLANGLLSLSDLQPIKGFTPFCTAAYETPIISCPDAASFIDAGSTAGCDRDCFNALNNAALVIQRACQDAGAYGDTLISHAFQGDLSVFLCGNEFLSGSNSMTATNVYATTTSGSLITKTLPGTTTTTTASTTSTSTDTKTATDSSSSTTTRTSSQTSSSSTIVSSSATSSSIITSFTQRPTSTLPAATPTTTRFDSTPFDQGLNSGALSARSFSSIPILLLTALLPLGLPWVLVY